MRLLFLTVMKLLNESVSVSLNPIMMYSMGLAQMVWQHDRTVDCPAQIEWL